MIELSQLIKTMTTGEKRYFSLLTGHYERGKTSHLKQLYQLYSSANESDNLTQKKRRRNASSIKNNAAEKHRLGQQIIDSLIHYHDDSITVFRLRKQLSQAELLVSRNLYREAGKLIQKVIKICREACLFELELEALRILTSIQLQQGIWDLEEIYNRRDYLLECIHEIDTYNRILTQLVRFRIHYFRPDHQLDQQKEIKQLLKATILQADYIQKSPLGKIGYHSFYEQFAFISGNTIVRIKHSKAMVSILTNSRLFAEVYMSPLLSAAMNALQNAYEAQDVSGLQKLRTQLIAVLPPAGRITGEHSVMLESLLHIGQLYEYLLVNDFHSITSAEKTSLKIIEELEQLKHFRAFTLSYILAVAFLAEGNYKKAARIIALADPMKTKMRAGFRIKTQRYFLLLCHFRLRHFDMIAKLATEIQRDEDLSDSRTLAEQMLIDFFMDFARTKGNRLREKIGKLLTSWANIENADDSVFVKSLAVVKTEFEAIFKGSSFDREWRHRSAAF